MAMSDNIKPAVTEYCMEPSPTKKKSIYSGFFLKEKVLLILYE